MESSLELTSKYFRKWKIKINSSKTQAILFPFRKSPKLTPRRPLQHGSTSISFSNEVKYLGVTFDKHLRFHKHIETIVQKSITASRSLYGLMCRKSKLSINNKNLLFKTVIRPIMSYSSAVWYKAAKTNIRKLQRIQNKNLKTIFQLPWRYPTSELHKETGYEMFNEHINRLTEKFLSNCRQSDNTLIRLIPPSS